VGARIDEIERWFVRRGVPHFIGDYAATTDIWTRSIPTLVVAYLAGGLHALDLRTWTWQRNLVAGLVIVAALAIGWSVTNIVRRRRWLAMPTVVGWPELAVFVIGPVIPSVVLGQWADAAQTAVEGLVVLAAIYLLTSYAVPSLLVWAARRSSAQVRSLAGLVVRALPLLLLFTTFLFINTEVWQVAGTLSGVAYVATLSIFFLLGAVFVLSRVPALLHGLNSFASWDDVGPLVAATPAATLMPGLRGPLPEARLSRRQQANLALVAVFSQALQITVVALLLTSFFTLFGFLSISQQTTDLWIAPNTTEVLLSLRLDGRTLVVTEPLLRVAGFLGTFSGMYFTVLLSTDATYRDEFADDVTPQLREALAVRVAYLAHRQRIDAA
jgi:hypothetical protein